MPVEARRNFPSRIYFYVATNRLFLVLKIVVGLSSDDLYPLLSQMSFSSSHTEWLIVSSSVSSCMPLGRRIQSRNVCFGTDCYTAHTYRVYVAMFPSPRCFSGKGKYNMGVRLLNSISTVPLVNRIAPC